MARSFDYSKWDNIELSDDESDLHPNIDKDSWFRLKHRTRLEREEREDQEVEELKSKNQEDEGRIAVIQARLKGVASAGEDDDAQYEDVDALNVELKELSEQVAKRNKRIAEIKEKRQWNIDNICKVKEEKTIVNNINAKPLKADVSLVDSDEEKVYKEEPVTTAIPTAAPKVVSSSTAPPSAPVNVPIAPTNEPVVKRERMAIIDYNEYAMKHEALLEKYSEIQSLEETRDFLFKHCDILLHEHAQSYMLLSCLEDEMNGKHKRMKLVCRQSQILSHIHELGISMKRDPRDVILPFFKRIEEKEYLTNFQNAVNDFIVKIQKRAVEKRKEMDAQREEEEMESIPLGPGGLHPLKVLKSLPIAMKEAFESQDIEQLQHVLNEMNPTEAKYWMKQCVDSGLWNPSGASQAAVEAEEETSTNHITADDITEA